MKDNEIEVKFKMILDLIYNERIAQKYTQNDIAEYLNIKTNTYSLIENGKQKLLLLDLIKISRFLNLDFRISNILESNSHNSEKTENCKKVRIHILLDGRDVGETSALDYVNPFEDFLSSLRDDNFDIKINMLK